MCRITSGPKGRESKGKILLDSKQVVAEKEAQLISYCISEKQL